MKNEKEIENENDIENELEFENENENVNEDKLNMKQNWELTHKAWTRKWHLTNRNRDRRRRWERSGASWQR